MTSKTRTTSAAALDGVLPGAQFGEHHSRVIDASAGEVWERLQSVRWTDLRLTLPLVAARGVPRAVSQGVAQSGGGSVLSTFAGLGVVDEEPPRRTMFVVVGKPWLPTAPSCTPRELDAVRSFDRSGWLKYGMEWQLHPLPGGRVLVETWTLCEATDRRAQLAFGAYWALIRAGSGLIRRELLAALSRGL